MKLVIVGGSAHSTPALVDTDAMRGILDRLEVVLVGRSPERLAAVARAMRTLALPQPISVRSARIEDEIDDALDGADLILIQARYGGYVSRGRDETFPLAFGIPGDEGLGPGGLASAWRSWPHLSNLCHSIEKLTPHPEVVLLTAPLGILTRCALNRFPNLLVAGLCELPRATLREICDRVGVSERRVRYSYAGVNHLGWFDRVETPDCDVLEAFASTCDDVGFPDRALIERFHAIPLSYMKLHYRKADVVVDQRAASEPRALALERLSADALTAFIHGDAATIRNALGRRRTPWYDDAVGPYIAARCGMPRDEPFFLTTANDGYLDRLSPEDVLEIPFTVDDKTRVRVERSAELREPLLAELEALVGYERLATAAVLERSPSDLTEALMSHPWVLDRGCATALATAIYAQEGNPVSLA